MQLIEGKIAFAYKPKKKKNAITFLITLFLL